MKKTLMKMIMFYVQKCLRAEDNFNGVHNLKTPLALVAVHSIKKTQFLREKKRNFLFIYNEEEKK